MTMPDQGVCRKSLDFRRVLPQPRHRKRRTRSGAVLRELLVMAPVLPVGGGRLPQAPVAATAFVDAVQLFDAAAVTEDRQRRVASEAAFGIAASRDQLELLLARVLHHRFWLLPDPRRTQYSLFLNTASAGSASLA